jgi:hypothetical protein
MSLAMKSVRSASCALASSTNSLHDDLGQFDLVFKNLMADKDLPNNVWGAYEWGGMEIHFTGVAAA